MELLIHSLNLSSINLILELDQWFNPKIIGMWLLIHDGIQIKPG